MDLKHTRYLADVLVVEKHEVHPQDASDDLRLLGLLEHRMPTRSAPQLIMPFCCGNYA